MLPAIFESPTVPEIIKIDRAHADPLFGLVRSMKPSKLLELGYGGGRSCTATLSAAANSENYPEYTLVDNWLDFSYKEPEEINSLRNAIGLSTLNIVTSTEEVMAS
jgi:hypothetical protein